VGAISPATCRAQGGGEERGCRYKDRYWAAAMLLCGQSVGAEQIKRNPEVKGDRFALGVRAGLGYLEFTCGSANRSP
jgi:hypothetical protein